jgi:hypothetical protein
MQGPRLLGLSSHELLTMDAAVSAPMASPVLAPVAAGLMEEEFE